MSSWFALNKNLLKYFSIFLHSLQAYFNKILNIILISFHTHQSLI